MRKIVYIYLFTILILHIANKRSAAQYNLVDTLESRPWKIKRKQSLAQKIPHASIYEFNYKDKRLIKTYQSSAVVKTTWGIIPNCGPAIVKIYINHGREGKKVYMYTYNNTDSLVLKQCEGFKRIKYRETLTLKK